MGIKKKERNERARTPTREKSKKKKKEKEEEDRRKVVGEREKKKCRAEGKLRDRERRRRKKGFLVRFSTIRAQPRSFSQQIWSNGDRDGLRPEFLSTIGLSNGDRDGLRPEFLSTIGLLSKFLVRALNQQVREHFLGCSLDIIRIQSWSASQIREDAISFHELNTNRLEQEMASEERNLVEILEENIPIDMAKYIAFVSAPQAGAISTFAGTTRDNFEGKTVVELRYEAYVPMAIRSIKSICSSARSSWKLHSIAVAHRLGPVPVGEISVFIAVSAVHRADAMDSCRFVIDELKASVPIWKKEVYDNGEVWKENFEFMDRRLELGKKETDQNENEAEVLRHSRKSCCGSKVKVNEESSGCISLEHEGNHQHNVENENEEAQVQRHSRKSCCGSKVKVNE